MKANASFGLTKPDEVQVPARNMIVLLRRTPGDNRPRPAFDRRLHALYLKVAEDRLGVQRRGI